MTKSKGLRPLVPNSNVETLCMAMFRAGVTETSYPAHPGMLSVELAKLAQLTTRCASQTLSWMARCGRAVVTTPHKQNHRRYVLSAAQVAQCAARLRDTEQETRLQDTGQERRLPLFEQITDMLAGARQLTTSEIVGLAASQGFAAKSVRNRLTTMWREGQIHRSGSSGSYVYSLPTQPAEDTEPAETISFTEMSHKIYDAVADAGRLTVRQLIALINPGASEERVTTRLDKMCKSGLLQRSGAPGSYVYSVLLPEPARPTDSSIVQATIDAFHQAGEPLSDEQIEALHHMHPDRHQALRDGVAAKALAKVRQEREAREARETALFEEYLQAAVEAEQMELLDT